MTLARTPNGRSRLERLVRGRDLDELTKRLARRAYRMTNASSLEFPLRPGDITDSTTVRSAEPWHTTADPITATVSWICAPPGPGSGGHTTLFRMVGALEAAGHECVIHLYDPHGVDLERYTRIIRRHWPEVRADVADIDDGIRGTDAVVATSWQTAHVLGSRPSVPGRRYYFVQDYEPYFYPRGSEYSLAEDTYRFGFEILALGHMVHDQIRTHTGADCTLIPFGRDTEVYSLRGSLPRNGIAFYSRPDTARRGSALAALGIDRFHARRPDQVIHLIGERPPMMTADVVHHGHREPYELAALYNSTICGIGMSFTNISLVVEEMLSCGSMVLVNDSPLARADVTHPGVTWVRPTPTDIANALCAAVDTPPDVIAHRARRAASHVSHTTWGDSGAILVSAIERSTRSGSRASDHEDVR